MKKYGLIGCPLGHSLSPAIHKRLFELYNFPAEYSLIEISPEELKGQFCELEKLEGFNATIPHKLAIIEYCDILDESAKRYGSVNCVKNGAEKKGYNTDVLGFTKSIELMGASLACKTLLIGCGGVGRMMAIEAALNSADLTIALFKKDEEAVKSVVAEIMAIKPDAKVKMVFINGDVISISDFGINPDFELILNASPIGMYPKIDNMPCDEKLLEKARFVFDVVYNPRDTLLVKTASNLGIKAMSGMSMLVLQAAAAHEIWNGAKFSDSDIKQIISDMEALV